MPMRIVELKTTQTTSCIQLLSTTCETLCAVVACGGFNLADSSSCWALLPDSTQRHCNDDSPTLIVDRGMWVTGRLQTNDDCYGEWTSEIYTGETWIPGPQHPAGLSSGSCLAEVNSTHSLLTGGLYTGTSSWLYDWTTGAWSESSQLNQGRWGHGCALH